MARLKLDSIISLLLLLLLCIFFSRPFCVKPPSSSAFHAVWTRNKHIDPITIDRAHVKIIITSLHPAAIVTIIRSCTLFRPFLHRTRKYTVVCGRHGFDVRVGCRSVGRRRTTRDHVAVGHYFCTVHRPWKRFTHIFLFWPPPPWGQRYKPVKRDVITWFRPRARANR